MSTYRHLHLTTVVLTAALAVTVVAGCSSSTAGTGTASAGSSSASAPAPTAAATPVAAGSSSDSSDSSAGSSASGGGGAQPPSGNARVHFGQSSLVALDDYTSGKTHPIKLTISVRTGSLSDLKNFQLDAQTKRSTPYYLGIQVTNTGPAAIDTSGFAGLLTVDDQAGDELNSLTLLGDFATCQGDIPDKLAPGASAHECDVYPAPRGARLATVSIDNGTNGDTIEWS